MDPGSVWGGEAGPAGGAVRLVPDLLPMYALVCAECPKSVRNTPALCAHVVPTCGRGRGRSRLRGVGGGQERVAGGAAARVVHSPSRVSPSTCCRQFPRKQKPGSVCRSEEKMSSKRRVAPWLGVPRVGCALVLQSLFPRSAASTCDGCPRETSRRIILLQPQQPADCKHKGGAAHPRQAVDFMCRPAPQPTRGERVGLQA